MRIFPSVQYWALANLLLARKESRLIFVLELLKSFVTLVLEHLHSLFFETFKDLVAFDVSLIEINAIIVLRLDFDSFFVHESGNVVIVGLLACVVSVQLNACNLGT